MNSLRIGIDIGGTFTDFVVHDPATCQVRTFKLLSTPQNPAQAVLAGLRSIFASSPAAAEAPVIIHGSTVATNALLERKGARTALVTTRGFRDVLQIGRQARPVLYDLEVTPPAPLVPAALRFELNERVEHTGRALTPLDPLEVDGLLAQLQQDRPASVAVCFLFSFLHPQHEALVGEKLRQAGFNVSLSSEILPEYREYERTSTTVVNAYVSPVMEAYLFHLESGLTSLLEPPAPPPILQVMQSNGGCISPAEARREAVRCILSGPAGGVVGCACVGRSAFSHPSSGAVDPAGSPLKLITFDMGGTSTDVSVIDQDPTLTTEAVISGCPIRIPMLAIHTIGAGGGSIARVDAGGALCVGPESAGADPGPACYGRGLLPTVTDANLLLGRLPAELFLGGEMPLDPARSRRALEALGSELGLPAEGTALGIIAVANAHMERALRLISVERGHDPRLFTLLSFGGAGGLHAADLARSLGIPRLLVPPLASTLSAFGMLAADVVKDYTLTVMLPGSTPPEEISTLLQPLIAQGRAEVLAEGVPPERIHAEPFLDLRYRGQSYELIVPFGDAVYEAFHRLHETQYGYANPGAPLEVVNLRLRVAGRREPPPLQACPPAGPEPSPASLGTRQVILPSGPQSIPLFRFELLAPGNLIPGPALIARSDTTVLLGPGDSALVDPFGNLLIEVSP